MDTSVVSTSKIFSASQQNLHQQTSKCLIVAVVVGEVAGIIFVTLGSMHIFGAMGSAGFIASIAAGGTLICVATGGVLGTSSTTCRNPKQLNNSATDFAPDTTHTTQQKFVAPAATPAPKQPGATVAMAEQLMQSTLASSDVSATRSTAQPQAPLTLCAPALQKEQERLNALHQSFIQAAQARMRREPVQSFTMPNCTDSEFKEIVTTALDQSLYNTCPKHIHVFGGTEHVCITIDQSTNTAAIPGVLFKCGHMRKDIEPEYLTRVQKATTICKEHNLYLLYVPQARSLDFSTNAIMEEKVEFFGSDGSWVSQRDCYLWLTQQPELQDYAKELFRQMLVFILHMNISDVKPDNVPLRTNGQAVFVDLDDKNAIIGLIRGGANGEDGLFSLIPMEWHAEYKKMAEQYIPEHALDLQEFQEGLATLQEKIEKRDQRRQEIASFYQKNQITLPTQGFVFHASLLSTCTPEVQCAAELIIACVNKKLISFFLLSGAGREASVDCTTHDRDDLVKTMTTQLQRKQIATDRLTTPHKKTQIIRDAVEALAKAGYCASYSFPRHGNYFTFTC